MSQATLSLRERNPDILSCIANLSNDEVFTPPEFAQRMLDTLAEAWAADNGGASIWENAEVTFLDPCTKSGVFLREISKRLIKGLATQIPDLQTRVDHILTRQIFGIGITKLTAMLARRSLYCSKQANGPYSIAGKTAFDSEMGNIWFERVEHSWKNGSCVFCGASQSTLDRGETRESHAYAFIHSDNIKARLAALFGDKMQFDVIIGNPPYQLSDGGAGASAKPIYHQFISQAKRLEPRHLCMVTPARWIAGGKRLDQFREEMLGDNRIRVLVDFLNASEAFPGVDVAGGITYFLWDKEHAGQCQVTTIHHGEVSGPTARNLNEFDVFVRQTSAVSTLHKIWPSGVDPKQSMADRISSRNAFGFPSDARGSLNFSSIDNPVELISSATRADRHEWVSRTDIRRNAAWADKWKSTFGGAAPAGGRPDKNGMYYGLSSIRILPPGTVCTESYLVAGVFQDQDTAKSLDSYLRTKFVRFLISLRAVTQHVTKNSFTFVPKQSWDRQWTDEMLYEKYGLSAEEVAFIEKIVRPMELDRSDSLAEDR